MARSPVRFYIWTSLLVILGIIVWFFQQMYTVRTEMQDRSAEAFVQLSERTAEIWRNTGFPEAGQNLSALVVSRASGSPLLVSVYGFEWGVDYLWAIDDRFLPGMDIGGWQSAPIIHSNDLMHSRYSRSFETPDGEQRIITAVYPAMSASAIFPILKRTLIAVLAFVAVVLVVSIVTVLSRSTRRTATVTAAGTSTGEKTADQLRPTPVHTPQPEHGSTALNPESILERRLNLELERAGYYEQDLCLALFEFTRGRRGDEQYDHNANAVLSFFTFEDLCFEYGASGVAVVFPNTGLPETLKQVERFQRYYWEERGAWSHSDADFLCGVSSRNGRLVEGHRVLGECQTSLKRAGATSGRIVGFQPDPDRYRDYLSDA